VIAIENVVVVVVVEKKYIHLLLVEDDLMNIDFDKVVEYYS
jgi:hypothetical protein